LTDCEQDDELLNEPSESFGSSLATVDSVSFTYPLEQ
ncbi:unnamed protein product, partial [Allacma fusca]